MLKLSEISWNKLKIMGNSEIHIEDTEISWTCYENAKSRKFLNFISSFHINWIRKFRMRFWVTVKWFLLKTNAELFWTLHDKKLIFWTLIQNWNQILIKTIQSDSNPSIRQIKLNLNIKTQFECLLSRNKRYPRRYRLSPRHGLDNGMLPKLSEKKNRCRLIKVESEAQEYLCRVCATNPTWTTCVKK